MTTDEKKETKPSSEWIKDFPDLIILDPDGWDRKNFKESWEEEITAEEFARRVSMSTQNFQGPLI